jgi:putative PIN family toxin of toxin-antitoxin system
MEKLRVVFDCMIFLQALISEKSIAFRLFENLEKNLFTLYVSNETISEVKNVLNRSYIRAKNPQITDENVEIFLSRFLKRSVLLKSVPPKFKYSRDPKDEIYINLAIEAEGDYLISRDRDLLDLMTDISIVGKEFRQKSRPLKIIEPIEFFKVLAEKDQ